MRPIKLFVIGTFCCFLLFSTLVHAPEKKTGKEKLAALALAVYVISTEKIIDELARFETLSQIARLADTCYEIKSDSRIFAICPNSISESVNMKHESDPMIVGYILTSVPSQTPVYMLKLDMVTNKTELKTFTILLYVTTTSLKIIPDSLAMRLCIAKTLNSLDAIGEYI